MTDADLLLYICNIQCLSTSKDEPLFLTVLRLCRLSYTGNITEWTWVRKEPAAGDGYGFGAWPTYVLSAMTNRQADRFEIVAWSVNHYLQRCLRAQFILRPKRQHPRPEGYKVSALVDDLSYACNGDKFALLGGIHIFACDANGNMTLDGQKAIYPLKLLQNHRHSGCAKA
jgi:hypothetical protein